MNRESPDHGGSTPKAPRPGTARAAFAHRDFRNMWSANFLSSIGTWMQNVVLPAYVYSRTESASTLAFFTFAQLGPLLLLSIPAGVMADKFDRRRWLLFAQVVQAGFSLLLGFFTATESSILLLFLANLGVGIGNSLNAPAFSAILPSLVPPEDLGGSISLSSTSVNGSRVAGPVIVALLMSWGMSASQVFFLNAATYVLVMWAVVRISLPPIPAHEESGLRSLTLGLRTARDRTDIGRILVSMASFSLVSLPFVGLFAAVASLNFGVDPGTSTYKWLYATWGLGAMCGALSIGTVFASVDKRVAARRGFAAFAVTLGAFAAGNTPLWGFVSGFALGVAYFATTTSLMTVLQSRLEIGIRARVLALWFMAFGGTVPIGNLVFGPVIDRVGARPVLFLGAAWAMFLSWWCDIVRIDRRATEKDPR